MQQHGCCSKDLCHRRCKINRLDFQLLPEWNTKHWTKPITALPIYQIKKCATLDVALQRSERCILHSNFFPFAFCWPTLVHPGDGRVLTSNIFTSSRSVLNEVRDDHVFWLQEAGIRVQGLKFLHGGICIGLWDTTTPFTISKYVFASKKPERERGKRGPFAESQAHRFYHVITKKVPI